MATLTFVYSDSTAVLGPLSFDPEPGAYDLCLKHAQRTSVPKGWQVLKIPFDVKTAQPEVVSDDLMALADAVRAIGLRQDEPAPDTRHSAPQLPEPGKGRHLRLVGGPE